LHVTNAPIDIKVKIPDALSRKLGYFNPIDAVGSTRRARPTLAGILAADELAAAKALVRENK